MHARSTEIIASHVHLKEWRSIAVWQVVVWLSCSPSSTGTCTCDAVTLLFKSIQSSYPYLGSNKGRC